MLKKNQKEALPLDQPACTHVPADFLYSSVFFMNSQRVTYVFIFSIKKAFREREREKEIEIERGGLFN